MDELERSIRENSRGVERSFWIRKLITLDIDTDLIEQINSESSALSYDEVINKTEKLTQQIINRSNTNDYGASVMSAQPKEVLSDNDFLKGQRDCKDGSPPMENASDDYLRGYSAQYELEQVQEYLSRGHR